MSPYCTNGFSLAPDSVEGTSTTRADTVEERATALSGRKAYAWAGRMVALAYSRAEGRSASVGGSIANFMATTTNN